MDTLIKKIAEIFLFNTKTYPALKDVDEREKLVFSIRHSVLHMTKTSGRIAEISEDIDHGAEIDKEALKKEVNHSIINSLRLAELVGIEEKDINEYVEELHSKYVK